MWSSDALLNNNSYLSIEVLCRVEIGSEIRKGKFHYNMTHFHHKFAIKISGLKAYLKSLAILVSSGEVDSVRHFLLCYTQT